MKRLFSTILLLLVTSVNAETMGWRIPMSHVTTRLWYTDAATNDDPPLLEKPPGKSAFFEKSDRLFDMSTIVADRIRYRFTADPNRWKASEDTKPVIPKHFRCDWVVWNERSETLVARGNVIALEILGRSLGIASMPALARCEVRLETSDGATESVSVLGRSGEKQTIKNKGLKVEVAPNIGGNHQLTDLNFHVEYHPSRGRPYFIQSSTTLGSNDPVTVASWNEGEKGWVVRLSCDILTTYDVSFYDLHLIELDGMVRRMSDLPQPALLPLIRKSGELRYREFRVPPDFMARISELHGPHEADPFVKASQPQVTTFGSGDAIDASRALGVYGINFKHEDSIALFFQSSSILLVVNDSKNLDLVEQIVGGGCGGPANVLVNFDWGLGASSLTTRSGEMASISTSESEELVTLLEVAPNVGSGAQIVDLNCFLKPQDTVLEITTAMTLSTGVAMEAARYTDEGHEHAVRVEVTATPEHGH